MSATAEDRMLALSIHFGVPIDQIEERDRYGLGDEPSYRVEGQPGAYSVLTDDEANEIWEACLDSYLDDCILPKLPEFARSYFDEEAWKRDARYDGRGYSINSYDGDEHEVRMPDSCECSERWLYVYRVD